MKKLMLGLGLALILAFAGCRTKSPAQSTIAAKVGNYTITMSDLEQKVMNMPPYTRQFYSTPQGKKQLLDEMIKRLLLVNAAIKQGLDKKSDVKAKIRDAKYDILSKAALDSLAGKSMTVTDKEITDYYNGHQTQFNTPEMFHAKRIVFKTQKDVELVYNKLRQKKIAFENAVKEYSVDVFTKSNNGDMGFFTKDAFGSEVAKALSVLKPNEFTKPFKTSSGWAIYMLIEKRPPTSMKLEQVKDNIRRMLEQQKQGEAVNNLEKELRNKNKVTIYAHF